MEVLARWQMSSAIRTDYQHTRTRLGQVLYGQFGEGECVSVVYTSDREGAFDILSGVTTVCLCLSHFGNNFGGVCPECPLYCSALPRVVRRVLQWRRIACAETLPSVELERLSYIKRGDNGQTRTRPRHEEGRQP